MERRLRLDADDAVALYGRALSLDRLADAEKSNSRLEQAIVAYRAVVDLEHGLRDDRLYRLAALRCIDRMRFRGTRNFNLFYLPSFMNIPFYKVYCVLLLSL